MDEHMCDNDTRVVHLSVRIPRHLKDTLTSAAQSEDRSLSYYIKRLLAEHAEQVQS